MELRYILYSKIEHTRGIFWSLLCCNNWKKKQSRLRDFKSDRDLNDLPMVIISVIVSGFLSHRLLKTDITTTVILPQGEFHPHFLSTTIHRHFYPQTLLSTDTFIHRHVIIVKLYFFQLPSPDLLLPDDSSCNVACSGNANEMCGGSSGRNSVFKTGAPISKYVPTTRCLLYTSDAADE